MLRDMGPELIKVRIVRMQIQAVALDPALYRPYGEVIAAAGAARAANAGTAQRFNNVAALENLRPGAAPNLCVFRVQPAAANPFPVRMLERHRHSTQAFMPMAASRYLVVVCGGGEAPDLSTLKAFIASGSQGVTYKPGTWHHPLIALDRQTDFACLVYEDGGAGDCDEHELASAASVTY
jgi:ureidoglycolate lyase